MTKNSRRVKFVSVDFLHHVHRSHLGRDELEERHGLRGMG